MMKTERVDRVCAPPNLLIVENACINCGTILPYMEERYCDQCKLVIKVCNPPRDSFGRFMETFSPEYIKFMESCDIH
jgi:hypothetical protein